MSLEPENGEEWLDPEEETPVRRGGRRAQTDKKKRVEKQIKPALERHARIFLPWLRDRRYDKVCEPRMRLYLYLIIMSKEGSEQVLLSNKIVSYIGLDRFAKKRALAHLVQAGLVAVIQQIGEVPVVEVQPPPSEWVAL